MQPALADAACAALADPVTGDGAREWSTWRYRHALQALRALARPQDSLVDIGCGVGNVLELLARETGLQRLTAIDVDPLPLAHVRRRLACPTIAASVLDGEALRGERGCHDLALLGDVLHHLVGPSRRASRTLAVQALANTAALLRPGGHLLLLEPSFRPQAFATLVFHLKRLVARLRPERLELGPQWANVGAPVVSLYDGRALRAMVAAVPSLTVVAELGAAERKMPLGRGRVTLLLRARAAVPGPARS